MPKSTYAFVPLGARKSKRSPRPVVYPFLLCVFIFSLVVFGIIYFLLSSKYVVEFFLPGMIKARWHQVDVARFKIAKQEYLFPSVLAFKNLEASVIVGRKKYDMTLDQLRVSWGKKTIRGRGLQLKGDVLS